MLMPSPDSAGLQKSLSPWADPVQWACVNQNLEGFCRTNRRHLGEARVHAGRIKRIFEAIFPLMDTWCRVTCPACREVCCRMARIWLDEKDLIFIHLSGTRVPAMQLTASLDETCRSFGPTACRLPRPSRPWRCTRFLCRPQEAVLRKMPRHGRKVFKQQIEDIDHARSAMARAFVATTHRCGMQGFTGLLKRTV